jgi:hypothetical protein
MFERKLLPGCLTIASFVLGGLTPLVTASEASAQSTSDFKDLPEGHWSQDCVSRLVENGIINGYPDNTFRPDRPVSRAEYAAIVATAFPNVEPEREGKEFSDIPSDHWASDAIQKTYRRGFLSGYTDGTFKPNQDIPRVQAFVALASGLDYSVEDPATEVLNSAYVDANRIPNYGRDQIAAATQKNTVIEPPQENSPQLFNPDIKTTRSQVAGAICQAKFDSGLVPSDYVAEPNLYQTKSVTAESGNVESELFYQVRQVDSDNQYLGNARLHIDRNGEQKLNRGLEELPVSFVQDVQLQLKDLNSDGEPEAIANLQESGPQDLCCVNSQIYRYAPSEEEYEEAVARNWNFINEENDGYYIKDADDDGNLEFHSLNTRFRTAFSRPLQVPYLLPEQIFEYRQGELVNATDDYPNQIDRDAYGLWQQAQEFSENEDTPYPKLKTALAGYLAEKYVLGESEEGWKNVQRLYQKSDRTEYFDDLYTFLREQGYVNYS